MRILLSAYSCKPNHGSEDGNGWNWARHLAQLGHEVWVLTRRQNRQVIEEYLANNPLPNLRFVYVTIPEAAEHLARAPLGDLGWQIRYIVWQQRASSVAEQLDRTNKFDVAHHVTWASITGGSKLWSLGKPLVFGPVGGGQVVPPLYQKYFTIGEWRKERLRSFVYTRLARFNRLSRETVRRADLVLTTNRETYDQARQLGASRVESFPVFGVPQDYVPERLPSRSSSEELRLLWVGSPVAKKGCFLALESLSKVSPSVPWRLTVIGYDASSRDIMTRLRDLGIANRVDCIGRVPAAELKQHYLENDVLLFTSLQNSLGAQLLEAMACGLPVIALDHQGARDFVPDDAGKKISVAGPTETARALARAVEKVYFNRQERLAMGRAAYEFAKTQTWNHKAQRMTEFYSEITATKTEHVHDLESR
jgi:glycosyltransferase involved in cell wall biosynthesis